jgi:predicted transcriptional regulator
LGAVPRKRQEPQSGGPSGCGGASFRTRRLLESYFDLTLQIQDHLGVEDVSDVLMLVLIGIADLRGAPMDAELLAEKLLSSRSTVERRLRSYLASGRVLKERRGKSVVYLLSFDHHEKPEPDMSVDMVRSVMAMVLDISND